MTLRQLVASVKNVHGPLLFLRMACTNRRHSLCTQLRSRKENFPINQLRYYSNASEKKKKCIEEELYDMYVDKKTQLVPMDKLVDTLKSMGLREDDPRLKEFIQNTRLLCSENKGIARDMFDCVILPSIDLISKAFRQQLVIKDFKGFTESINEVYCCCEKNNSGEVATYIPELAKYNPKSWGVSVCTVDGQRLSIGDVREKFTMQSCSKPLIYAIALEIMGPELIRTFVGNEPSGSAFNALKLNSHNKPHNAMINTGAIVTCSLMRQLIKPNMNPQDVLDYTIRWMSRMSGCEKMKVNEDVFLSERGAADRNYSLGFYMREFKCFPKGTNLNEVMDYYFQCCSIETNCEIMSTIAATLANGGVCPMNGEKVLSTDTVRDVLSTMHSCGTYDYSGQFAFKVGLPAKSGVSGSMMLVVPNVMGICAWSPPLDKVGNSVRALQFCEQLISEFKLHQYDSRKHMSSKKDPRKHRYEDQCLPITNMLYAAACGNVDALRLQQEANMDFKLANYDGRTALHLAAAQGELESVKFLLEECKVPHDPKDRWGNLPITDAEKFDHSAVADYIKSFGHNSPKGKNNQPNKKSSKINLPLTEPGKIKVAKVPKSVAVSE